MPPKLGHVLSTAMSCLMSENAEAASLGEYHGVLTHRGGVHQLLLTQKINKQDVWHN
jgi:hypothetical protein